MRPLYKAENLRKTYGDVLALDLPEFYLEENEILTLTGPNGCGKSTLLRLLAFIEKPTSGKLRFFGDAYQPRREATLLLQEPYLLRETVFRNVVLGLLLRGRKADLQKEYEAAMRLAGFRNPEEFARRRPSALSGGEKQRVALASRLILKPRVLLLDEPTSNVDKASAKAIVAALAKIPSEGAAIVCATHDHALLAALPSRNLNLDAI